MTIERIPLTAEPISGTNEVARYDNYAGLYMLPEYKYFGARILRNGIRAGRVLDIGTGSGKLAIELAKTKKNAFEITGLDISPDMIRKARQNAGQAGVSDRIQFVQATAARLPFPDKTFDLVMSYASLHHWLDPVATLNEAQRVAKDNGLIIIRDNRRVTGSPYWETFIWLLTRFMTQAQRRNWRRVIRSSYTLGEVKALVNQSQLSGSRVGTDFVKFDLFIERAKP